MKKLILKPASSGHTHNYKVAYSEQLNAAQLRAVMHGNGPVLLLAGAGTGKTRTLTYRVARLIEDGVDPSSILLLTFTRKAANQMLRRSASLLDGRTERISGGTFHSVAYNILRTYGLRDASGNEIPKTVRVLDQSDAEDVMNLARSRVLGKQSKRRFPRKDTLFDMYSRSVNTTTALVDVVKGLYPQFVEDTDTITDVVRAYTNEKLQSGLVDYDDLLLYFLASTRDQVIGGKLRERWKHVLVDEYQDTNRIQHEIVKGLAGSTANVMVVGDDAQSIYGFRGADVRNIHAVPDTFDGCTVIKLEENYRSSPQILEVCNNILRGSTQLFEKNLYTQLPDGDKPILIGAASDRQQSAFVVQHILELREQGKPLSEIAILVRSAFLSFDVEIELGKANIPFRKFGGLRFTEAAHVKDVLAFLRLTENPADVVSWYRVLLLIKGIGPVGARTLAEYFQKSTDAFSPLTRSADLPINAVSSVNDVLQQMSVARSEQTIERRLALLCELYRPFLEKTYDDHPRRWKDVETVVGIAARYSTVQSFLDDIAVDPPQTGVEVDAELTSEDEYVTISTIHSAKGLEWDTVFLPWLNDGRLPSSRAAETEETLDEERRLLYVACSRARRNLILLYVSVMFEWEGTDVIGRASRFLDDISVEEIPRFYLSEGS